MKKKLMYEVPDVELIELRLEETVLTGSPTEGGPGPDDDTIDEGDLS